MAYTFREEWQEMISGQILAAKSFYDPENSATSPKSSSDTTTLGNLSKRKLGLQLSLEHFNPPLLVSNTSPESGNEIAKRNDFLELVLPELWTLP
jgi:hypothetical protein